MTKLKPEPPAEFAERLRFRAGNHPGEAQLLIEGAADVISAITAELSQARERITCLEELAQDRLDVARELERERDEARASYAAGLEVQRDQLQRIEALGAELAALRACAPDGWKLVPVQATPEMEAAGWIDKEDVCPCEIYAAMLAAAPQPPAQAKEGSS